MKLTDRIRHAANAIGREDKRGCQPCKDKMLDKMVESMLPCVFRGEHKNGTVMCNVSGTPEDIKEKQCYGCPRREW